MSRVTFRQIAADQANIHDEDGDCVGEVFRYPDILRPGHLVYTIHYFEDPRGPVHVSDRSRIRQVAEQRWASHPLLP